ncbi:GNAT family N-acetyltransferase [Anaerocolumna sp. MB42-C2]|uniref:GNAT family N-acetyltransferase n=1 Tax=Anaerocolumna sp. MB42-C2 TaxID=3070997 RepID=UPI0027E0BB6E|nr:GNAT family N-acetyltransferase [Anaerocolumna sp. MB42-C2]WMJ88769.1 GNAT family N-acetyltransferase [Anaerocolumna sp. MB42-C2]
MNVLKLHVLNEKQKNEIDNLVRECLKEEKLERTLYMESDINYYINMDSFFLLYNEQKLVSVLTVFQPLKEEAEINAYTLPTERKKGYFDILLSYAEAELCEFGVKKIIFVVEPESKSGMAALKTYDTNYYKSEYLLKLDTDNISQELTHVDFNLNEITLDQRLDAVNLSHEIFDIELEEAFDIIDTAMAVETMHCYGFYAGNSLLGICNVNYGENSASIFGFGIKPDDQGKGYGRILLNFILVTVKKYKKSSIILQVGSENKRAFLLYQSVGFQILKQYDYYEYFIE